jgi:hypothetical protein
LAEQLRQLAMVGPDLAGRPYDASTRGHRRAKRVESGCKTDVALGPVHDDAHARPAAGPISAWQMQLRLCWLETVARQYLAATGS